MKAHGGPVLLLALAEGICSGFGRNRIRPIEVPLFLPLGSMCGYYSLLQHSGWTVCAHRHFHIIEERAWHGSGMFANGAKEWSYLYDRELWQWRSVLVLQAVHPTQLGIWLCWELLAASWLSCILKQKYWKNGAICLDQLPLCAMVQVLWAVCPGNLRSGKKISVFSFNAIFILLEKYLVNGASKYVGFQYSCMGPFYAFLMHVHTSCFHGNSSAVVEFHESFSICPGMKGKCSRGSSLDLQRGLESICYL